MPVHLVRSVGLAVWSELLLTIEIRLGTGMELA